MATFSKAGARALNKPALILGVSPGLAGMAFALCGLTAGLADTMLGKVCAGILLVVLWSVGKRISKTDPELLLILSKWLKSKNLYDPLKVNTRG